MVSEFSLWTRNENCIGHAAERVTSVSVSSCPVSPAAAILHTLTTAPAATQPHTRKRRSIAQSNTLRVACLPACVSLHFRSRAAPSTEPLTHGAESQDAPAAARAAGAGARGAYERRGGRGGGRAAEALRARVRARVLPPGEHRPAALFGSYRQHRHLDTGSANTAVVTADCCSLTNSALYSCASSSTCASQDTTVSVSYITGAWSGDLVQDTFSGADIGAIPSFPFTEILQESNFIQTGYDGIVGLGYSSIAAPTSKPPTPYFEKLQATKSLANVFSMLMCGSLQMLTQANATLDSEDDLYSGELIMGGTEGANGESYYQGELVYTPLVQNKWYNVVITDLKVANTSLGLDCKAINTPRSIVDSGTSNIAFPSEVYSAVLAQLKTDVRKVIPAAADSFFSDDVPCCSTLCDPTNANSAIYSLPALSVSLAVDGKSEQITVSIPPEYIWRPILVSTNTGSVRACRVFGISEGDITLLGDVFMDGLFTVHDRENDQLGFGVAKSCPNGVTSSKTVTVESLSSKTSSLCDCVSNSDKKSSLLSSYFPIGSSKPCFFWQWWMYVVLVCVVLIVISIGAVFYISWRRRKLLKELHSIQSQQHSTQQSQRAGSGGGGLPPRQVSDGLERNLLTPSSAMHDSVAPAVTIAIHNQSSSRSSSFQSLHHSGSHSSISSANGGGGYRPPSAPTSLSGSSSSSGRASNNNNNNHYRASGSPEALHAVV